MALLVERCGWMIASGAIMAAATLTGSSVTTAVAWSLLPQVIAPLQSVLLGNEAQVSAARHLTYAVLAINFFVMHACVTEQEYVGTALEVFAAWCNPTP